MVPVVGDVKIGRCEDASETLVRLSVNRGQRLRAAFPVTSAGVVQSVKICADVSQDVGSSPTTCTWGLYPLGLY